MRRALLHLLLSLMTVSCADSYLDGVLDRSDAMMMEHPDSSLLLLQQVSVSDIDTPRRKARYSLEYAMALDKNWIDTSDVDIIQPALAFYHGPFWKRERFLTHYYYARILENGEKYPEAILAFSEAEHYFRKGLDSTYLIRIASAKARIYTFQLINDRAEESLLMALRLSKEQKDKENTQRMTLSLADYYEATKQYEKKDSLLSTMGEPLPGLRDWKAVCVADIVFRNASDSLRYMEDWGFYRALMNQQCNQVFWSSRSRFCLFEGRYKDALSLLSSIPEEQLGENQRIALLAIRMEAEYKLGQYQDAYLTLFQYSSLVESLSLKIFQNDLRSIEERYRNRLNDYRNRTILSVFSIITLLLLGALGWVMYRKKKKEVMLSDLKQEYEILVQLRHSEIARNEVFSKRLDNRLIALKPYITGSFPDELSDSSELRRMTEDSKQMLSNISFLFGLYHPKFVLTLEEKGLSEMETGYCCLYALGYVGKEIPDKLHRNSFYNTSSNIRKKIGLGPHDTNLSLWVKQLYQDTEGL